MENENSNLWDIQPGESKKAFEMFWEYYKMGAKRSMTKLASKHHYKDWKNPRSLYKWSKEFQWDARIKSYISYIIKTSLHNALITTNEMIDNTLIAFNMASKVLLNKIGNSHKELENMEFKELFKIMIDASKVVSQLVELKTYSDEQASLLEAKTDSVDNLRKTFGDDIVDEIIGKISNSEAN